MRSGRHLIVARAQARIDDLSPPYRWRGGWTEGTRLTEVVRRDLALKAAGSARFHKSMEDLLSARRPAQAITLGIVIYALWLLLSGIYTPWFLGLGAVSTALAVYFALRMDFLDHEGVPVFHLSSKFWTYLPWLFMEIVRSNVAAARIILHPDLPVRATMIRVRARQRSDLGRVIFANSITLTPGTVTVAVVGEDLHVHALDGDSADGMDDGEMNHRVAALERGER